MSPNDPAVSFTPAEARRIVVKLGTQVVVSGEGELERARIIRLVRQCADWVLAGREVLIVTSGAVGLGLQALKKQAGLKPPLTLVEKQACAAVGQNLLMDIYRELFAAHGVVMAQVLLSAADFADRVRYNNLHKTLEALLGYKVIPVINENDTVSTQELQESETQGFGDNDKLSALVAAKLEADLLVILTTVDGIYTDNPHKSRTAEKIPMVESLEQLTGIGTQGQSALGRGGMTSKLEAARIAAISGVHTVVASGAREDVLAALMGEQWRDVGTWILPQAQMPGKKRWIGLASGYKGIVVVNEGARKALAEKAASLLAIGITDVQGDFRAKQVVSIQDEGGNELGRGLVNVTADDIRRVMGRNSGDMRRILGVDFEEVIRRDNLVMFEDYGGAA